MSKVKYHPNSESITVDIANHLEVAKTVRIMEGVHIDVSKHGEIVAIDIFNVDSDKAQELFNPHYRQSPKLDWRDAAGCVSLDLKDYYEKLKKGEV